MATARPATAAALSLRTLASRAVPARPAAAAFGAGAAAVTPALRPLALPRDPSCKRSHGCHRIRCKLSRSVNTMVTSKNEVLKPEVAVIQQGDYVAIHYVLTGAGVERQDSRIDEDGEPMRFKVGEGIAPKGFEAAAQGKRLGDKGKVHLTSAQAFGEPKEELKRKIPMTNIPELYVGDTVKMVDGSTAQVIAMDKESITLDFNHPLAGKALDLEFEIVELLESSRAETAHFAMGCFWGPQLHFERVPGVLVTKVGYTQGNSDEPSYEDVCSGNTGHTEAVEVIFDPSRVSYRELLQVFWENHNPTQLNAQGNDRGTQYRGGIYFLNGEQEKVAKESMKKEQAKYSNPIATEVLPAKSFWPAEECHQLYLSRGGRFGNRQSAKKGCDDPVRCYG